MKTRILVVDDDVEITDLYRSALETRHYKVFTANSGTEALSVAEKELPDLILLGVMMPDFHGLNVLKMIKSDRKLKNIKVLILTALSDPKIKEKAKKMGAVDYLIKSETNMAEVIQFVGRLT
jgi:DNA-binding response OmpR family regulator